MSALDDTARLDWLAAQQSYSLSNLGGGPKHHLYISEGDVEQSVRTVRTATKGGLREVIDALRGGSTPTETDEPAEQLLTDIIEQALERAFDAGASNNTMPSWEGIEQLAITTAAEVRGALSVRASEAITGAFVDAKVRWSHETFGPGARTAGVCNHIRKELAEVEANPRDVSEWADIILLAMDGAVRAGATGDELVCAVLAKDEVNRGRTWPDWRTLPVDSPIEHEKLTAALTPAPVVPVKCPRWGTCFSHDCTCHPSAAAVTVTEAMVNAAAKTLWICEMNPSGETWEDLASLLQNDYRNITRGVLTAALTAASEVQP